MQLLYFLQCCLTWTLASCTHAAPHSHDGRSLPDKKAVLGAKIIQMKLSKNERRSGLRPAARALYVLTIRSREGIPSSRLPITSTLNNACPVKFQVLPAAAGCGRLHTTSRARGVGCCFFLLFFCGIEETIRTYEMGVHAPSLSTGTSHRITPHRTALQHQQHYNQPTLLPITSCQ